MALSPEVVDLVGFDVVDDVGDLLIVGEVAIVEKKPGARIVRIGIDMVESGSIEGRCPPDNPMHLVALMEEKLGEIRAVLSSDAGYQRFFWNSVHSPPLGIGKRFVHLSYMDFVFLTSDLLFLANWS